MKFNFHSLIPKNKSQFPVKHVNKITHQELAILQKEKIAKDIEFFNTVIPYTTYFTVGVVSLFFLIFFLKRQYAYVGGQNLWNKFYFKILDIDIVEKDEKIAQKPIKNV